MLKTEQPKTLKDWMSKNLSREELKDIVEYGCEQGVSGLTYYNETSALYDAYHKDIWKLLEEQANDSGYDSISAFIASFNGAKEVRSKDAFNELLVWYAVEEQARVC